MIRTVNFMHHPSQKDNNPPLPNNPPFPGVRMSNRTGPEVLGRSQLSVAEVPRLSRPEGWVGVGAAGCGTTKAGAAIRSGLGGTGRLVNRSGTSTS